MNRVKLPRRVDFGACALLDVVERCVVLRCEVPIAFEYRVAVTRAHAQFELVSPLQGVVAAHESVRLLVRYSPLTLGTSVMQLQVEVSQLDAPPHAMEIVGNCVAGLARARALDHAARGFLERTKGDAWAGSLDHASQLNRYAGQLPLPRPGQHWDLDYVDKGGTVQTSATTRAGVSAPFVEQDEPSEYVTEGLRIPVSLAAGEQRSVNYVLTQQPGKLKPKDLPQAVAQRRLRRAEQRKDQEELRALTGADAGALSAHSICAEIAHPLRDLDRAAAQKRKADAHFEALVQDEASAQTNAKQSAPRCDDDANQTSRQLREQAFLQDLNDLELAEKEREFKGSEEFFQTLGIRASKKERKGSSISREKKLPY